MYSTANLSARRSSSRRPSRFFLEALESRILLSQTWTVGTTAETDTQRGTDLNNVLTGVTMKNGLYLQQGDTIVLLAGYTYSKSTAADFTLPYLAGTGTLTIESSAWGSFPSGRIGPAQLALMPKIAANSGNSIIQTVMKDIHGNAVVTPPHDYAFLGIEILPTTGTKSFATPFLALGDGSSAQNSTSLVPYNFTVNQCYIHGYDDLTNANLTTDYKTGIGLNCLGATIQNSYISDIHNRGADSQAIGGWNGMGNYTITNNFLEATGENFMMGGADSHLGTGVDPDNITLTHNFFFKRLVWDPVDSSFLGTDMDVKNIFELKHATHVTLDQNLLENCWLDSDQKGEGMIIRPVDQSGGNTWALVHDVTITNNIIENVGNGIQVSSAYPGDDNDGFTSLPMYNVTIRNNLIETDSAGSANDGNGDGMTFGGFKTGDNLTVDHNTTFNSRSVAFIGGGIPYNDSWTHFTYTNNVVEYGILGFDGSVGEGTNALQAYMSGITMTNQGSGYSTAPSVTFSAPGGSGTTATGTAVLNSVTNDGLIYNIKITNSGSGYSVPPTITIAAPGGGGTTATATAELVNGQVRGWIFSGNVIFGSSVDAGSYPPGNFFNSGSATEDMIGLKDPAGEFDDLLSTSPFYTDGVDANGTANGSTPGVNMASFAGITDFVPIDNTVTGYWKFDEGTGTTVSDSSGNGKTGTLNGSASWTTAGQSFDGLALTGGNTGSVSIPNLSATSSFTFSAWIKPAAVNTLQYIASTKNASSASGFSLYIDSTGHLTAKGTTGTVTDTSALTAGKWYLVTMTFNGTTLSLYKSVTTAITGDVNMTSVGTPASATTTAGSTTLYLGGNQGSTTSFNGTIDEARYYSSDMSATDINGISGVQRLYKMFGPLIGNVTPQYGGFGETGTHSTLTGNGVTHSAPYTGSQLPPASLSFTWSEASGPAGVTFDANNGLPAAHTIVATWPAAGIFLIRLVVTDAVGGSSTTYHKVYVAQTPTPVSIISPPNTSVGTGGTVSYTQTYGPANIGVDQFGNPLLGTWSWAVAPGGAGGTIDASTGIYKAPLSTGTDTIQLKYDDINSQAVVAATTSVTISNIPAVPSVTSAIPSTSALSIALNWSDTSPGVTGYNIQRSSNGGSTWSSVATAVNGTTWTDNAANDPSSPPAANTSYIYQVNAYFTVGNNSAWSASSSAVLTIPAAPTGLVATPGTSTIALTWTDPSPTTNITGYHIYRSTDNSTWGSVYGTASGATATTFTDSAPAAGTAYYYKVTAYDATGDSASAAGMSCFVATVIAYDGFNYTVSSDGTTWNGHNTGIGFAAGATWSLVSTTKAGVTSGSLAPIPVNGHTLTTSANSVTLGNNQSASQTLANSVGAPGTTLWVSFEAAVTTIGNAVLQIGTTASNNYIKFGIGANSGQVIAEGAVINGVLSGKSTSYTASTNTTYFLVLSIQYLSTGDILTVWADPQPDKTLAPTNYIATATETLTTHMPATTAISLTTGPVGTAIATFDEIRLGNTYASVAPDPLITPAPSRATLSLKPSPTLNVTTSNSLHTHFQFDLAATPTVPAQSDSAPIEITPSYHLEGQADQSDSFDPDADSDMALDIEI